MSNDKIDMSLEDIIKGNRRSGKGGAARRGPKGAVGGASSGGLKGAGKVGAISRGMKGDRGGVRGATRGGAAGGKAPGAPKGKSSRGAGPRGGVGRRPAATPYTRSTQVPDVWKHDLYEGDSHTRNGAVGPRGAPQPGSMAIPRKDGGKTIIISNLYFGVNDSDITGLFGEFGTIKKSSVRYDKSGRSLESAEVVYDNSLSASKAMKRYNDVPLDGKLMKITIVGGEEVRSEQTLASRLGAAPVPPQPRKMIHQPRGGHGDQGQLRNGYGGRGGGRGGSGRGVSSGKGKDAGGGSGRGGKVAAGGSGQGTGGGRGAGGRSGRGAGASGGFEGRGGPRRGRSGANGTRKVASKEDLDAQLDAYKMETD